MIGETLRTLIRQTPAIAALVVDRVHPNVRPTGGVTPALVYAHVSSVREMSHGGYAKVTRTRYQINAYARDYGGAERLLNALYALDGFRGTVSGRSIGGAFFENAGDVPNLVPNPGSQTEYAKRVDLVVWHD